ncbi:MAG: DUF3570 domain-containing protein [Methylovulum sp.]|nr:DUF3570 domain-containing protein [Methylovulum sp.]
MRIPVKHRKKNTTLARLACAALALPGIMQTATAGRVEETYNADFQYGHYSESNKRIEVNIFEGAISAPIGKALTLNLNLVRDVISGASPVYNQKTQGQVKQVISAASPNSSCGASICEQRDAISSGLSYFFDSGSVNLNGGVSKENDYLSRYVGTNLSLDLNKKKLTTFNLGGSVAFDEIDPSISPWAHTTADFGRIHENKTSQNYLLGVTQVIDKDSLFQSNQTFSYSQGYLTDPYKWVEVAVAAPGFSFSLPIEELRPREKFQWAWLNQYVRHFDQFNDAALHLDYRFTMDDWGVDSHTFEAAWYQPIAYGWQLIPRVRYYSQNSADFYQPTFNGQLSSDFRRLANYSAYSSDYRLAGFGAISGGVKLSKEITDIKSINRLSFQAGIEYYDHQASYQLGSSSSSGDFANFNYYLVTASFNLKF